MTRPRILLADEYRIVAEGLRSLLSAEFTLVGIVEDGRAMIAAAKRLEPDVIVADIAMPHLNGIDAFVQLRKDVPRTKVVFLTIHSEVAYVRRALEAGALGFVLKHATASELILAIRTALDGKLYITPALAGKVVQAMQFGLGAADGPSTSLTPRQREVLQLLVEGQCAREIGSTLEISRRTVEFHKYQMMESLGLRTSAELLLFAVKHRLIVV